jgi:spoIIIJ-associated protein
MESAASPSPAPQVEVYLARIEALLRQVIQHGEFDLAFEVHKGEPSEVESPEYVVMLSGADADLLLEKNATLLDALEHVVLKAVRLDEDYFGKITLDCQDWRRMRVEELKLTAEVAANRVVETGAPFSLNPMNPRERRIVHLALKDRRDVQTLSEGRGPERRVVIHPASSAGSR